MPDPKNYVSLFLIALADHANVALADYNRLFWTVVFRHSKYSFSYALGTFRIHRLTVDAILKVAERICGDHE